MTQGIPEALAAGLNLHRAGRLGEAEQVYRAILARQPDHADAMLLMSILSAGRGELTVAEAWVRQALAIRPNVPQFHSQLSELSRQQGRFDAAVEHARRATELDANVQLYWMHLGLAHLAKEQWADAQRALRRTVDLEPNNPFAWPQLAAACHRTHRHAEAIDAYERALRLNPNDDDSHYKLGYLVAWRGEIDRGVAEMRRSLELQPHSVRHGHLLYLTLFQPGGDTRAEEIFLAHREWAKKYAEPLSADAAKLPHANLRDPQKRLRVGYVSPYFRQHAISYFSEPMLAAHDSATVEVFCYNDAEPPAQDAVTHRLKSFAHQWRDTLGLDDAALAQLIRDDGIDVLVDLTGHIPGNRLLTFARMPAPVQVTYLGYQATTGMSAMDYRLTDAWADPAGTDRFYTEKLVRLPLFFVYRPHAESPAVGELPMLRSGHVTFGSMNTMMKVNAQLIQTWAVLMNKLAGSRLRILIPGGEDGNDHVRERFAGHGITGDRIDLLPLADTPRYLALYNKIDIALDPFPFGGHTTTCDALWMGVPTVVLAGEQYVSRMGVSVMNAIGAGEWLANSTDDYVTKLVTLASDADGLAELRAGLRGRLQSSPAMDAGRFTASLEYAYRQVWTNYCQSAPAAFNPSNRNLGVE